MLRVVWPDQVELKAVAMGGNGSCFEDRLPSYRQASVWPGGLLGPHAGKPVLSGSGLKIIGDKLLFPRWKTAPICMSVMEETMKGRAGRTT